jgi:uncharacterized protein
VNFRVLRLLVVLSLAAIGPVAAQTPPAPRGSMALPVDPQLLNDLPELKGVVPWRVLGQVTTAQVGGRPVPEFSPEIRKLDQQDVRLQGYMLPIVAGETHDHFLLTMRPPHCPFCLSLGPEYIVEVKSRAPIKHTYEPVVVAGRLNVLRSDPFGVYYRLTEAQLSSASR